MLWRIAWRNLWRHRGRTLIIGSAVALSYALMLFSMGVNDDSHGRMLREAARAAGGDVLVHGRDYWNTRASDIVIRGADRVGALVERVPGVGAAAPRVLVSGLVGTAADTRPVLLSGILPERELALRDIAKDLKTGTFLTGGEPDPIVLGSRLVERLEARLGDRIVLTATEPNGEVTRALFHLTGIVETGARQLDEYLGYTTLEAAQRAVAMTGMVTQIGIVTQSDADVAVVAADIRTALGGADSLEVLTWQEAVPEMVGLVEIDNAFGIIYLVVIYAVVLFSITNTFLMAVMERVREFGLLNALGLTGARVGRLMLNESVLMTLLAMVVGFALGFAGHLAVAHWGISMAAWGVEEMEAAGVDFSDLVVYSTITPIKWIIGSIAVALVTVASAAYPAWRASRLAPAEAMRFYE
jgi:ABC-type lipoprotein release transport system permease subunit